MTSPNSSDQGMALPLLMVLTTAFLMRSVISGIPPALGDIQRDLHISPGVAGLTMTIPLLCYGVFAFATPLLMTKLSYTQALSGVLVLILLGNALMPLSSLATLLLGVGLVGVGVAVGNVIVPVILRLRSLRNISRNMGYYTVMINLGAAFGAAGTGLLMGKVGLSWQLSLLLWAPVTLTTLVHSLRINRAHRADLPAQPQTPSAKEKQSSQGTYGELLKQPRTWVITAFTGLQSCIFFAYLTWLPAQLQSTGMSLAEASFWLMVYTGIATPIGFVAPHLFKYRSGIIGLFVIYAVGAGVIAITHWGGVTAMLSATMAGIWQGATFAFALMCIANTPDHRLLTPLSAFAQGVGFLVAAVAPSGFALLKGAVGSWAAANLFLSGGIVILGVLTALIVRIDARPTAVSHIPLDMVG